MIVIENILLSFRLNLFDIDAFEGIWIFFLEVFQS